MVVSLPTLASKPDEPAAELQKQTGFRSKLAPTLMAGGVVFLITVFGFGLWAALTPLASGVHVMGKVAVETQRKTVDHLEGGIVKQILIEEGSRVRKGDPLIVLEGTQTRANHEMIFARFVAARVSEARLGAERRGSERFALPEDLAQYVADERVRTVMQNQLQLLEGRRRQYREQISVQQQRIEQSVQQAAGLEANRQAILAQLAIAAREDAATRTLFGQGFATVTQANATEREVVRLQGEAQALGADRQRVLAMQEEARQQLEVIHAGYRRDVSEQIEVTRGILRESSEQLQAAQDAVRRSVIRAPQDGQVVGLAANTVGGVVAPGATLMFVVPDNERLLIEGQIKPLDASYVYAGMPAEVKFSGLPRRTTPLLRGNVLTVSTDTLNDPKSGASYYLVRVEIGPDQMRRLEGAHVTPGMPVEILIEADQRTVLQYLTAPWTDLFRKAMREY